MGAHHRDQHLHVDDGEVAQDDVGELDDVGESGIYRVELHVGTAQVLLRHEKGGLVTASTPQQKVGFGSKAEGGA